MTSLVEKITCITWHSTSFLTLALPHKIHLKKIFLNTKSSATPIEKIRDLHYHMKEFLDGGGTPNFKIIGIFEDEISALLFEVYSILSDKQEKGEGNLNISDGGEGNLFELCFQDRKMQSFYKRQAR